MTDNPLPHADALKYEDWAGEIGARWLANLNGFESTIAPVGDALLARAAYSPGKRVLDIGCGGGATTLAIAQAVQPSGAVLGIDISPDLIAATTRRAAAAGITNASFLCADAAGVNISRWPLRPAVFPFRQHVLRRADPRLRQPTQAAQTGRADRPCRVGAAPAEPMDAGRHGRGAPPCRTAGPRSPRAWPIRLRGSRLHARSSRWRGLSRRGYRRRQGNSRRRRPDSPSQAQQFACNAMAFGQVLLDYPEPVQQAAQADLVEIYSAHHRPDEGVMMGSPPGSYRREPEAIHSDHHNTRDRTMRRSAIIPLVTLLAISAPAYAEPTPVTVRVISQDAKFVGDGMGGARVTLREAREGHRTADGQGRNEGWHGRY